MLILSVVRAELEQGMARTGKFSQQESKVVFDLADIDGNGNHSSCTKGGISPSFLPLNTNF